MMPWHLPRAKIFVINSKATIPKSFLCLFLSFLPTHLSVLEINYPEIRTVTSQKIRFRMKNSLSQKVSKTIVLHDLGLYGQTLIVQGHNIHLVISANIKI